MNSLTESMNSLTLEPKKLKKLKKPNQPSVSLEPPTSYDFFTPKTLGEEVQYLVQEWYNNKGQSVPDDELNVGKQIDEAEQNREIMLSTVLKVYKGAELPLLYGTHEYWTWIEKQYKILSKK